MILENIRKKIISFDRIEKQVSDWKSKGETIVFTNGCFDIVHLGHITYLAKAADLGTKLIIGLNSDKSVKKIKGENKPIMDENSRAIVLASLSFVSAVVVFEEETPIKLIEKIIPNVLVKGGDYKPEDIVGYNITIKNKGIVKVIALVEGYSSKIAFKKFCKFVFFLLNI